MNEEIIEEIRTFLAGDDRIVFAILFGSQANGLATPMSDIDIGIYVKEPMPLLERGVLITRLETITRIDVDCVVLNDLPYQAPILAFEIIAHGRMLVCNDFDEFVDYKVKVIHAHADFAPAYERMKEAALQNIGVRTRGANDE